MKIEYLHASKYGNGAMVAEEFSKQMDAKGVTVNVHHITAAVSRRAAAGDLYLFSSPGRMGKPIGGMRRFLKKVELPAGTKYAILTTGGWTQAGQEDRVDAHRIGTGQVAARPPDHERDLAQQGPCRGR